MWWPSENDPPGTVYPDSSFDVAAVPVAPGTNTLTATYVGPAYTNAPMTATDTSTVVLGDTTYTHDANGNLTGDATFIYQYDLANQLTNVTRKSDSSVVLQCRYDALGRRVEAIRSDGTVDRYVYFPGTFLVLAVLDGSNTPKELYTRGPDLSGTLDFAGGIGGILACTYSSSPSSTLFHHADLMGNIIALTDNSGMVTSTSRYTPFGQIITTTINSLSRHLFNSKEYDISAELYYYGCRYYSPYLSVWLTQDPLGKRFDSNTYRFCLNGVFAVIDVLGLKSSMILSESILYEDWKGAGCDEHDIHKEGYRASLDAARLTRQSLDDRLNIVKMYTPLGVSFTNKGYEYGGLICCDCRKKVVYATGPWRGKTEHQRSSDLVDTALSIEEPMIQCHGKDKRVGYYHSHPNGENTFSPDDIVFSSENKIPLYLHSAEPIVQDPVVMFPYAEWESITKTTKNGTGFSDEMWVGKDKYVYGIKRDGTLVPKGSGNLSN